MSTPVRLPRYAMSVAMSVLLAVTSSVAIADDEAPAAVTSDKSSHGSERRDAEWWNATKESNVDSFGAFSDSIAIEVPAFRSIDTDLAFGYRSSNGNGPVGVGWSLSGPSVIESASPGKGAPRYDASDIALLDGEELLRCATGSVSPSCTTGGTHSTKTESYSRIALSGTGSSSLWTITSKDGTKRVYGPVYSLPGADNTVGTADDKVFRWGLKQVVDTNNNVVTYTWGTNLFAGSWEYLDSIAYNGTTIKFYYEQRSDVETSAIGAGQRQIVTGRLKTVDVNVSGSRLRSYKLTYTTSGATARSLLSSVQQFGKDATLDTSGTVTGGTSFPAITAGYPSVTSPAFVGAAVDTNMVDQEDARYLTLDVNGDGKEDMVQVYRTCVIGCTNKAVAWISTGSAFTEAPSVTLPIYDENSQFLAMDVDGDGKDDLVSLTQSSTKWKRSIFLSNGNGFTAGTVDTAMTYKTFDQVPSSHFLPMDINADGKTDMLEIVESCGLFGCRNHRVAWLSTGSSFTMASDDGEMTIDRESIFLPVDINGDGKSDFVELEPAPFSVLERRVWISNGTSFTLGASDTATYSADMRVLPLDVNGDGKTDLVQLTPIVGGGGHRRRTWLSTGSSFVETSSVLVSGRDIGSGVRVVSGDVNGDGKGDLMWMDPKPFTVERVVFLSNGTDFVAGTVDTLTGRGGHRYLPADVDGDGREEMIELYDVGLSTARRAWLVGGPTPDLLTSLGTGLGGTKTVGYTPSSAWTNTNNPPIVQTATSVTIADGRGGSATTTYSYSGGKYDVQNQRFVGFAYKKETLPCIAGESVCPYNETWFLQGSDGAATLPSRSDQRDGSGKLFRSERFEYTTNGSTLPWTALATGRWIHMYVGTNAGTACPGADCKRRYRSRAFNAYGEVTQEVEYGDYDVTGDERTVSTLYFANTAKYIVNRPADVKVFQGVGSGTLLNETDIFYDGATVVEQAPSAGLVTKEAYWLSSPNGFVTKRKTYDSWGNVTAEIDELDATTTFVFDTTYRLFPTSTTNALNQTATTTWDPICGVPTQTTNVNGQSTTLTYDALCRLVTKTEPGGKFETHSWGSLGNAASQYEQVDEPAADGTASARWRRRYFDGLSRTWRTMSKGPNTTAGNIYVDTAFNARGKQASKTAPYFYVSGTATTYTTTFGYDAIDRLIRVTYPDSAYDTTSYDIWSVTETDELGRSTTDRFNAYGRRVSHDEIVGGATKTTSYVYDARQNLQKTTDPAGNITTTLTTDSLGRVTQQVDLDWGTTTFEYDGAGRLTAKTDAKNQRTTYEYDKLDRKKSKTTNAGTAQAVTVAWAYDEPRAGYYNVGALTTMTDGAGTKKLDYDVLGRVVKAVRTINGTSYTNQRGFDAGGRVLWTTYPDGDTLGTSASPLLYDSAGWLKTIPGYVTSATYNADGNVTQLNNANATVTTRSYSAQRGWVTGISTTTGATTLQNLVFTRNAKGMITNVTSPIANEGWSYTFDELDRLTTATNTSSSTYNQTLAYDAIGNITTNSRLGSYAYHATKKHAVVTAGANTFTYDATGLMTSGAGRTLTWNGDNRLATVTNGGTTYTMTYDADGDRIAQAYGSTTHHYLGDDYEIENGWVTKHVSLGDMLVATKSGTTKLWIHTDHLGSIQAETDAAGAEVYRKKYRPYGEILSAAGTQDFELRGYTAQRHDDSGLIYLHARYYDPVLGRFISGDDVIDGDNTAGLNRYAYTQNDPVNRSDVTGKCITCINAARDERNDRNGNLPPGGPGFVVNNKFNGPYPPDPTTIVDRLLLVGTFVPIPGTAILKVGQLARSVLPNLRLIASGGPTAGAAARTTTAVAAGTESLILPRSLGAAANITTQSRIGESHNAIKLAESLSEKAQKDVDALLAQVRAGNANPGIGTRSLGDGFYELRGSNAGRVIIKQTDSTAFDIVGKFQGHVHGDTANSNTIQRLISDYNGRR